MKKALLMIVLIFAAIFLGSLIGDLTLGIEGLSWLGRSYSVGISTFDIDTRLITLTLGFHLNICIAQVLLILTALICYPKLSKSFFG